MNFSRWSVLVPGWCAVLSFVLSGPGAPITMGSEEGAMGSDSLEARLTALTERFREAAAFDELCRQCRQKNVEMDQRSRALEHTETQHTVELDKQGQTTADEKGVERVWFVGEDEFRQTLAKEDALSGKPKKFDRKPRKSPKSDTTYPFTKQETSGMYRYEFERVEPWEDRPAVRVRFEPQGSPDGLLRGSVWLDPDSGQCLRFEGEVVKLPRFVSEIKMTLAFGPAENGHLQTRHSVVQTGGGVGVIQKRFRIETVLDGYRPPSNSP